MVVSRGVGDIGDCNQEIANHRIDVVWVNRINSHEEVYSIHATILTSFSSWMV